MSHRPVTTSHTASPEEREFVIQQIYKQVLERPPYESERRHLADIEHQFMKGKIGIRHFLKRFAVSRIYLEEFHEKSSNVKFIENAFKHFLGRTPHNEEEIRNYDNLLLRQGVGAMISEMIDSEEYRKAYGIFTVPFWRGTQTYQSPSDYIENRVLEEEHAGQRGWGVPTLYRHELEHDLHLGD